MPAHYDDPDFSYLDYWRSRDYENQSEISALASLLGKDDRYSLAADIGGGYGRLTPVLTAYARRVILVEPSAKQRRLAARLLSARKSIRIMPGKAEKTGLDSNSVSLAVMIRVMHHLPDPALALLEIFRVLKPGGVLILEFANSKNFKSRIISLLTGRPILPVPVEKRSLSNIRRNTIAFVNHHPHTVHKLLKRTGFVPGRILSVSNFRSPLLKRILPSAFLIGLENRLQPLLADFYFGPSIFIKATKPPAGLDKQKTP